MGSKITIGRQCARSVMKRGQYRHKYREKILGIMRKGEVTVSTFTKLKKNPIPESTARRELKNLRLEGLIDKRKAEKGRTEYYFLPGYEKGEPVVGAQVIIRRNEKVMQYYKELGWLHIKDITESGVNNVLMEYTGKPMRPEEVKKRIRDAIKRLKSYGKRGATLNEIATESGLDIELVKKYVWPIAKRLNFAIYEREKKLWEE